ncbi:MAG TPA: FAD-binding oxidoreductase [bacterium]|jgi:FAD/FMN-containing dehydrogenase
MAFLRQDDLESLRQGMRGEVVVESNPSYNDVRKIWNGIFDRKPEVIARCVSTPDVVNAIRFAREHKLPLAIRGGGHNSAGTGTCDAGMMIDLSLMRRVNVDRHTKTARVDGGALLGDVDAETQLYGMVVPSGIISHTGVGGLTLGGGFGWTTRKFGMSIDNLLSAEVVTANGDVVTASAKENEDLFWGLRGGGGNFGVVTSFVFRCAEVGKQVYSGLIIKKFENLKKYYQFHREFVRRMPDNLTVWTVVRHAPPLPFIPPEYHGKLVIVVPFAYVGDPAEGEKLIKPVRDATETIGEAVGMNPWTGWQSAFDPLVSHGARNYWKSHQVKELPDAFIDRIAEFAMKMPTDECEAFIPHLEGAMSRVGETETAFAHRKVPFNLNIHTRWREPKDDERCKAWARDFHAATAEFAQGAYVNFQSDLSESELKIAYTPAVMERLITVKNRWDPDNLFCINQNIKPKVHAEMLA